MPDPRDAVGPARGLQALEQLGVDLAHHAVEALGVRGGRRPGIDEEHAAVPPREVPGEAVAVAGQEHVGALGDVGAEGDDLGLESAGLPAHHRHGLRRPRGGRGAGEEQQQRDREQRSPSREPATAVV
jgi:hypothetical protein